MVSLSAAAHPIELDIWGARGSRSLVPAWSRVANNTSCYSLLHGEDLLVVDGGRGLAALGHAVCTEKRFQCVKRITLIVSHAHMDHWEGLKDCGWFWGSAPPSGLELEIFGPAQALDSVERAYERPSFMPLEVLAEKSLDLRSSALEAGETVELRKWRIETRPLNHYSGSGESIAYLDTLGLRITPLLDAEPVVSYLCDHEPTAATESDDRFLLSRANLALVDANFSKIVDHAFGHGSQEHTANLARSFPHVLFLATHHGPGVSDDRLISGFEHHARGLSNIRLAIEGTTLRWDSNARVFVEPKLELVQT